MAFFNGKDFDASSFKHLEKVDSEVEKTSDYFYAGHLDLIDKSILTKPQKFLLKERLNNLK